MRKLGIAAVLAACLALPAAAQERVARVISGFAAGGTGDLISRLIADAAGPSLGARVVVENRTGANGLIGAEVVARSAADGTTVLQCPMGTMTISPELPGQRLPVDPRTELVPVVNVALSTYGLVVAANGPYRSVADLLAAARARPGALSYASAGVGSAQHLSGELLKRRAQIDVVHVPYRGAAPAIVDILGGRADFMITNLGDVVRQLQGGELRLLALGDSGGSPLFPEARPVSDFVPGLEMAGWFGICGPRGMTPEAVARWAEAMRQAAGDATFRRRLLDAGLTPHYEEPESFARRVEADRRKWGEVIRAAGIRAE